MEGKIVIVIELDGRVDTHVEEIAGPTCAALLQPLEGFGVVEEEGHTDDYAKRQKRGVRERVKVGAR